LRSTDAGHLHVGDDGVTGGLRKRIQGLQSGLGKGIVPLGLTVELQVPQLLPKLEVFPHKENSFPCHKLPLSLVGCRRFNPFLRFAPRHDARLAPSRFRFPESEAVSGLIRPPGEPTAWYRSGSRSGFRGRVHPPAGPTLPRRPAEHPRPNRWPSAKETAGLPSACSERGP